MNFSLKNNLLLKILNNEYALKNLKQQLYRAFLSCYDPV